MTISYYNGTWARQNMFSQNTQTSVLPKVATTVCGEYRSSDTKTSSNYKEKTAIEEWQKGFDAIDTNQDGSLSVEEICDKRDKQVRNQIILKLAFGILAPMSIAEINAENEKTCRYREGIYY